MTTLRVATRGSDLALAQARATAKRVGATLGVETELVIIKTTGDRLQHVSLAKVGGKGLFVKEIEEALLDGRADLAVHSAKDLPAQLAPGLVLAAFPERVDPRDALVGRHRGARLEDLPPGARVGTGSARRTALLRARRADLEVVPLRGNVPTRLGKLESDDLAAVVLACAGLERLSLADRIDERLATDVLLPAVCQGTLALQAREGDPVARDLAELEDADAARATRAERAFLARLEGDCTVPLAAYAEVADDGTLRLRGLVSSPDGRRVARSEATGDAGEAEALGRRVADAVLADGGRAILDDLSADEAGR